MACPKTPTDSRVPEVQDARRARTRGALLFGYFLLGRQEKVTRLARRANRKLLLPLTTPADEGASASMGANSNTSHLTPKITPLPLNPSISPRAGSISVSASTPANCASR